MILLRGNQARLPPRVISLKRGVLPENTHTSMKNIVKCTY